MKESTYGPQFEKAVKDAGADGISPSDILEQVPSSRQTVYGWIRKNGNNLRVVGETSRGGTLYRWVDASRAHATNGNGKSGNTDDNGVEIGSTFTVTRLRFVGGRIVATLSGPNAEVEADLS